MWGLTRSRHIGEHMIPTAYVFDENPSGLNFFDRLGFVRTPAEQQAAPQIDYFGPNTVSPEMWRLQANNVIVTQTKILENIERKNTRVDFNNTGGNLVIEIKR